MIDWLTEEARQTLEGGYLLKKGDLLANGDTVEQDETLDLAYSRVVNRFVEIYPNFQFMAEDMYSALAKGWLGLSTPVLSNFGAERGLPISCFVTHLGDSIDSIYKHKLTVAKMSQFGGGVSTYFGDIRPGGSPISNGGVSSSVVKWVKEFDLTAQVVTQGSVRRGSIATYLPIEHPDLRDLLNAKDHSSGDPRDFIDCNIAVTITDAWMQSTLNGDTDKFALCSEVLESRLKTGSPYITFIDTVNRMSPDGRKVSTSNLCNEITLYTDPDHSAVCCLSSLNLAKYFEWKDWKGYSGYNLTEIAIFLLDAVMEDFILKGFGIPGLEPAIAFAKKSRALGLGVMGLHTLYQSQGYAWDSEQARRLNIKIHKQIKVDAVQASVILGIYEGYPEWAKPLSRRNTHLLAIAPTRTNSVITAAFSQGVEPIESNYYVAKQSKGTFIRKNPSLDRYLKTHFNEKRQATIWDSILEHGGSVQHLDILPDDIKQVYKTAREIDQFNIIDQASDRQEFICQGQSINLFVDADVDAEYMWKLHVYAWFKKLKGLYYLRGKSQAVKKAPQYTEAEKVACSIANPESCQACEG